MTAWCCRRRKEASTKRCYSSSVVRHWKHWRKLWWNAALCDGKDQKQAKERAKGSRRTKTRVVTIVEWARVCTCGCEVGRRPGVRVRLARLKVRRSLLLSLLAVFSTFSTRLLLASKVRIAAINLLVVSTCIDASSLLASGQFLTSSNVPLTRTMSSCSRSYNSLTWPVRCWCCW